MKTVLYSLLTLLSLQIYAEGSVSSPPTRDVNPLPPADCSIWDNPACDINQTASCITDKATIAMSPGADLNPGGAELNSFEFTRINAKMIHAYAAWSHFPTYDYRVQIILENAGSYNGLTRYENLDFDMTFLFDCAKNHIYVENFRNLVERLDIK